MTQGYTPDGYEFTATYDAENRLASIEYSDSGSTVHKAEYVYNGYGFLAQIKKYENSTPTGDIRLIRSGYLTIQERDASNNVVREYTWGKNMGGGIGGLLSMSQSGNLYNYLYDGRGNVSALLNTAQQVAASYRYDSFGNLMAKTGSLDQPFMFSTKRYDAGTGLSYYGYRFYNPTIGKWLTRDPIGEAGGINLYGFVLNDPVNLVDPNGLESILPGAGFPEANPPNHYSHTSIGGVFVGTEYSTKIHSAEGGWFTSQTTELGVSPTLIGGGAQIVFDLPGSGWDDLGNSAINLGLNKYLGISYFLETNQFSINIGLAYGLPGLSTQIDSVCP